MRRSTATTEYLKECMGTALLELMREKPIEKISIEEMTAKADVGRSTYFRYFRSKDEVLSFKLRCMWNAFSQQHHFDGVRDDIYSSTQMFFEFCLSIRDVSDMLYAAGHQNVILEAYIQIMMHEPQEDDVGMYYRNYGIAYALYGLVNAWIMRGYKETPEQMAGIILDVTEGMSED